MAGKLRGLKSTSTVCGREKSRNIGLRSPRWNCCSRLAFSLGSVNQSRFLASSVTHTGVGKGIRARVGSLRYSSLTVPSTASSPSRAVSWLPAVAADESRGAAYLALAQSNRFPPEWSQHVQQPSPDSGFRIPNCEYHSRVRNNFEVFSANDVLSAWLDPVHASRPGINFHLGSHPTNHFSRVREKLKNQRGGRVNKDFFDQRISGQLCSWNAFLLRS